MRHAGLRGVRRGKVARNTIGGRSVPCPLDRVNRQFKADWPNQLWVSDFTYVSTWQGWQYVAFVVDVFARRIVGWRQSRSMRTDFLLEALEQALYDRRPQRGPSGFPLRKSSYFHIFLHASWGLAWSVMLTGVCSRMEIWGLVEPAIT